GARGRLDGHIFRLGRSDEKEEPRSIRGHDRAHACVSPSRAPQRMSVHPYFIHLPLVLILIWPIVDACGLALQRPDVSKVGLALLLVAVAAALAATTTGQSAFDEAVKAHVDPELLD